MIEYYCNVLFDQYPPALPNPDSKNCNHRLKPLKHKLNHDCNHTQSNITIHFKQWKARHTHTHIPQIQTVHTTWQPEWKRWATSRVSLSPVNGRLFGNIVISIFVFIQFDSFFLLSLLINVLAYFTCIVWQLFFFISNKSKCKPIKVTRNSYVSFPLHQLSLKNLVSQVALQKWQKWKRKEKHFLFI